MKKGTENTCMKVSLLGLCFLIVSVQGSAAPQKQGNPPKTARSRSYTKGIPQEKSCKSRNLERAI